MNEDNLKQLNKNFWITANAGSGKTTQLVNRFLFLIENHIEISSIVCITYTEAGAKEMKTRIIEQCKGKNLNIKENQLQISTIHGLCQKLLNKNNFIPNTIKILNDDEYTFETIIKKILDSLEAQPEVLKKKFELVINDLAKTENIEQFQNLIKEIIKNQNLFLSLFVNICTNHTAMTTKEIIENIDITKIFTLLPEHLQQFVGYTDTIHKKGQNLQKELNKQDELSLSTLAQDILGQAGYTKFLKTNPEANLKKLKSWQNIVLTNNNLIRKTAKKSSSGLVQCMQQYYVEGLRQIGIDSSVAILNFAYAVLKEYQEIKQQLNVITYDDLLFQTKQALETNQLFKTDALNNGSQISYLMLDEAQDTNPISWDIIKQLIEITKCKFLVVGDKKQSIYKFQGAKVEEYEKNKTYFSDLSKKNNIEFIDNISLNTSYRSIPAILEEADEFCNKIEHKKSFTTYNEEVIKHQSFVDKKEQMEGYILPKEQAIITENIDLNNDETIDTNNIENNDNSEENLWLNRTKSLILKQKDKQEQATKIADILAKYILLNQEEKNKKIIKTSQGQQDLSNNVAIIYPRGSTKGNYIFDIINELKEKYNFNIIMKPEIEKRYIYFYDILCFFKFFALQNDDFNLACLLKSDFFEITDEILFQICSSGKDITKNNTLWNKINCQFLTNYENNKKVKNACNFLKTILSCTSIEEILSKIYVLVQNKPQYFQFFNLFKYCVEKYKNEYNYDVRGFLRLLESENFGDYKHQLEYGENNNQPKVYVSTIHGVKGMEFDTVIIVELETKKNPDKEKMFFTTKSFWYKASGCVLQTDDIYCQDLIQTLNAQKLQNKEEEDRLHYVAITRAKRRVVYVKINKNNNSSN